MEVTPQEVRARRLRFDWSLQDLAYQSGVNKAYLSEYENGKRALSEAQLEAIDTAFSKHDDVGTARPTLQNIRGKMRLVFVDAQGNFSYQPEIAHLRWTEADGSTYTLFVGNADL